MAENPNDTSPVGWYVGSYLLRFIELEALTNEELEQRFLAWENTAIVKAGSFDEAYEKLVAVAKAQTNPYKGGAEGVPVQWLFEGVTELLPIYEPLQDGAEIMWAEHDSVQLSALRQRARSLQELKQHLAAKHT
jgi:hypothetical protein